MDVIFLANINQELNSTLLVTMEFQAVRVILYNTVLSAVNHKFKKKIKLIVIANGRIIRQNELREQVRLNRQTIDK